MAKGYIKIETIFEVDSGDLTLQDGHYIEELVREEIKDMKLPNYMKIVDTCTDSTQYEKGIKEGFEDLFI